MGSPHRTPTTSPLLPQPSGGIIALKEKLTEKREMEKKTKRDLLIAREGNVNLTYVGKHIRWAEMSKEKG